MNNLAVPNKPKRYEYPAPREFAAASSSNDDDAKRQAVLAVVSIWLNRLALISGITSFFASIDSLLFSLASAAMHVGDPDLNDWSATDKLCVACFAGALILHVCSAIVAFLGSFVLVRLQLIDADDQERDAGVAPRFAEPLRASEAGGHMHQASVSIDSTAHPSLTGNATALNHNPQWRAAYNSVYGRVAIRRLLTVSPKTSTPKNSPDALVDPGPPVQLLQRCNFVALLMAVLGFILAVTGIIAYAWVYTPLAVSVFSTACLGGCILVAFIAVW